MSEADRLCYLEFCVVYACVLYVFVCLCMYLCVVHVYLYMCPCALVFLETRNWHLVSFSIKTPSPLVLYLNWYAHVGDLLLEKFDKMKAKLWILRLPACVSCLSSVCGLWSVVCLTYMCYMLDLSVLPVCVVYMLCLCLTKGSLCVYWTAQKT